MPVATCVLLVLAGASAEPGGASERPPYRLYAAAAIGQAPTIDGRLDDPCWTGLPVTGRFTRVLTAGGLAEAQTSGQVGYDARCLYIALSCDEPRMAEALQAAGSDAYQESVEVFIDADLDRCTYQQYRVALDGQTEFRLGYGVPEEKVQWQAAVLRGPYAWTVEMAIPWSTIGVEPKAGLRLGFNMNRCRANVRPVELSGWSNTEGGFHAPGRFGDLVLGDFRTWLRQHAAATIEAIQMDVQQMLTAYPASTRSLQAQAAGLGALVANAHRYIGVARNEDAAIAVFELIGHEISRAQAIAEAVRLAVIAGEFR